MSLDYKLERTVRFSDEIEHKSLYSWCLREFDTNEKQVGGDQIPWGWGLDFTVLDLAYNLTLEQERKFKLSSDKSTEQLITQPVVKKESLYGRLVPEKSGPSAFRATRYSFFGTKREIGEFSIRIVEGDEEAIDVWGSPEWHQERDMDVRPQTFPDNLQVTLVLKSDHFRDLVDLVKSNTINRLSLRLRLVEGFYSDWSPSISTDNIKVLPAGKDDGKVYFPDEKERPIPRLGKASEYQLHIGLKKTGIGEQSSSDDDEDRYDIREDRALAEKLKKLLRKITAEEDEDKDDAKESEASKDKADDGWRYSPLIRQFSVIYNQARMSLIRSEKSNRIGGLFRELENLTYDFRSAVGQGKSDKKNSHKSYKSDRPQAFFWSPRNLNDIFRKGTDSSSAFPDDVNGFDNLDSVAQEYFSGHWKSSYLEKTLCEAFISLEAFLYVRSIKENITNLAKGRAAIPSLGSLLDDFSDENIARKNNYNMDKMTNAFLKRTFTRFGKRLLFFVGLPALVGVLAYSAEKDWSGAVAAIAAGIVGVYISYHAIKFILQLIFAGIRKGLAIEAKENGWEKAVKLFSRMAVTYRELSEGNALPYKVLKLVEKDSEEGISYRSSLVSILLRASDDKNYIWGTEASEF